MPPAGAQRGWPPPRTAPLCPRMHSARPQQGRPPPRTLLFLLAPLRRDRSGAPLLRARCCGGRAHESGRARCCCFRASLKRSNVVDLLRAFCCWHRANSNGVDLKRGINVVDLLRALDRGRARCCCPNTSLKRGNKVVGLSAPATYVAAGAAPTTTASTSSVANTSSTFSAHNAHVVVGTARATTASISSDHAG